MFRKLRARRPRHGTVVAYLALFIALGGTAYAAATVGSGQVIDNSLQSVDLKDNAGVKSVDVVNDRTVGGGLRGQDIIESQLGKVPDANKLDGLDSSAFRVRCPGGTRFHEGACIETSNRGTATWSTAETTCRSEGRRLPSVSELKGFLQLYPGPTEWSDRTWYFTTWNGSSNVDRFYAIAVTDERVQLHLAHAATAPAFRCVASPSG